MFSMCRLILLWLLIVRLGMVIFRLGVLVMLLVKFRLFLSLWKGVFLLL